MGAELHSTHSWGERRGIPVCVDCKVEGYEDEPGAFTPCPGPPKTECGATMKSRDTPGHTHRCASRHTSGHHFCWECQRWFGRR